MFSIGIMLSILLNCNPHAIDQSKKRPPTDKLVHDINLLLADPNLASAHIGVYIEALRDHVTIFRHEADKLFIPASNMKLYTTACALDLLGADFRFRTQFYIQGTIDDSVLSGNLIVRGMGDPSISGRYRDGDKQAYFKDWADSLRKHGINEINGHIVADGGYFKDAGLGEAWNWDDEPYWYSAQVSALAYNDNCIDIDVSPGEKVGDALLVSADPLANYIRTSDQGLTCSSDSSSNLIISRLRGRNLVIVKGRYPIGGKTYQESITIEKPERWFVENFKTVLQQARIKVSDDVLIKKDAFLGSGTKLVFSHHSKPLSELIVTLNKKSHNFYAEQLFKTLGAQLLNDGSWKGGQKVLHNWLNSIGVAPAYAEFVDGSGLSRKDLVAPYATAAVLRKMYYGKNFEYYYNSLPIAGVDGTLRNRMKSTSAMGVVHAKTGYVEHVRSLSGYTKDKSGNDYIFVIMINNYLIPTPYINNLQDQIAVLLSAFKS